MSFPRPIGESGTRQSRWLVSVNRPRRFEVVSRSRAAGFGEPPPAAQREPPMGGSFFHMLNWSDRLSSASCRWMYSRTAASSRPTVETKYPRAQKCCPVTHHLRNRILRRDRHQHVHVVRHQVPFLNSALSTNCAASSTPNSLRTQPFRPRRPRSRARRHRGSGNRALQGARAFRTGQGDSCGEQQGLAAGRAEGALKPAPETRVRSRRDGRSASARPSPRPWRPRAGWPDPSRAYTRRSTCRCC